MALIEYTLYFDDEQNKFVAVNPETGEVKDITAKKSTASTKSTTSKKKKDENPNPQITLEDKKYCINTAAVELMGIEPEMKLCIKMRKIDGVMTPIIGTNEAFNVKDGNRVTKSFTVACRGANHDALVTYGSIFDLVENPDKNMPNTFIMKGDQAVTIIPDEITADVEIPEELNADLDQLSEIDMPDSDDIDSSIFEDMKLPDFDV